MHTHVVQAWAREIPSPQSSSNEPPPHWLLPPSASRPRRLDRAPQPLQKRRRCALSPISPDRVNMPRTRSQSPSKTDPFTAQTPSPTKLDMNRTPRPWRAANRHGISYTDALAHTDNDNTPPVFDAEAISSSSAASRRSTSPIKRVAALQDVGGGLFFRNVSDNAEELGNEGRQLLWDLDDSASGLKTIPSPLWEGDKSFREALGGRRPHPSHFDDADNRDLADLHRELSCIKEVIRESRRCDEECEPEAEWNTAVHGFLLRIVFGGDDSCVGYRCMTSDKIDSRWLPRHSAGFFSSRMIDYGIYLEDGEHRQRPSGTLQERLARHAEVMTPSVNHINRLGLRTKPIAVSIETKTIGRPEEEARVQLGIWIAAQIERLKAITQGSSSTQSVLARMIFPLLFVQSAQWTVMFARLDSVHHDRLAAATSGHSDPGRSCALIEMSFETSRI
ncbi:hypothetical protein TOPH_08626 [Tolypocladium ophioglossoides CBS 100239]|uniref:PD-(D/E)XK nuclease-like domain-containing protein n=1 Tax=Tolypocladium ophioglossoides (strain CBS 100239) TaxID=1163406 RepID=A0A0L0MZ09_TOLOC|nr:hypothetical protein TOPH_08626 [Tolypocladium ophioglossoides CBS 100239]